MNKKECYAEDRIAEDTFELDKRENCKQCPKCGAKKNIISSYVRRYHDGTKGWIEECMMKMCECGYDWLEDCLDKKSDK